MNSWRVVEVLSVLAEDSRYRLLVMLVQAGENGLPQGRLASRCGISEARLKRHLAKLMQARLIRRNHRRRGVVWKAEARQLTDLVETMTLRLKPQVSAEDPRNVIVDVPGGFRSLASKLASVAPSANGGQQATSMPDTTADATAPRKAAMSKNSAAVTSLRPKTRERRLPARLSEALATRSG